MSGIKYLLDTNYILGIMKATPDVLTDALLRDIRSSQCAYSAITRMELLGFPGIQEKEDLLIRRKLENFTYLSITQDIEEKAISLRQTRKIKLPDAIIAATALCHGLALLSFDKKLTSVIHSLVQ